MATRLAEALVAAAVRASVLARAPRRTTAAVAASAVAMAFRAPRNPEADQTVPVGPAGAVPAGTASAAAPVAAGATRVAAQRRRKAAQKLRKATMKDDMVVDAEVVAVGANDEQLARGPPSTSTLACTTPSPIPPDWYTFPAPTARCSAGGLHVPRVPPSVRGRCCAGRRGGGSHDFEYRGQRSCSSRSWYVRPCCPR